MLSSLSAFCAISTSKGRCLISFRLVSRCDHGQNMIGILCISCSVFLDIISQLDELFLDLIISIEEWRLHMLPLGKIAGEFPGVTVRCGGLEPVLFVHETGYRFVQCHIFRRKIVIVLVVGIEIF